MVISADRAVALNSSLGIPGSYGTSKISFMREMRHVEPAASFPAPMRRCQRRSRNQATARQRLPIASAGIRGV